VCVTRPMDTRNLSATAVPLTALVRATTTRGVKRMLRFLFLLGCALFGFAFVATVLADGLLVASVWALISAPLWLLSFEYARKD